MNTPSISLCMIAKNEEKNLANCLNSVKDIIDEVSIVDTGSIDKTKDVVKYICKNLDIEDVKIFDFKWGDDFSAARNESIKHATKDWILVLDADEVLDGKGLESIKEIINGKEADAFLFLQKNYTNETSIAGFVSEEHKQRDEKYAGWYGSFIVRLFRNKKGYEFNGTVHELVESSIESKNGKIAATDVAVHHYGNANPSVVRAKRKYYLQLCKKKVKKEPNASSYYELGVLYKENENFDDAISSFKKTIELNPKHSTAFYELGIIYGQQKNYDEAIKNYTESLRVKENSEAYQSLGVCYLKKGMLKEAYRNLVKAMLMNPNKYSVYNNLGAVLERSQNYDGAAHALEIGVKLNPKNIIGFYNLGLVLDKKGDFENAVKNYEKAVELGHNKKEEIKKRIKQLKAINISIPKYKYDFKVGG